MATLAQIRSRISRKLKDPNYTDLSASTIDSEINRSIRHFKSRHFWFNEEKSDITLTASAQAVPSIPSDLVNPLQVNGLMVIDGQVKTTLTKLDPETFRANDEDQTGVPEFWTFIDGEYLLLPTPDSAYTLRLRYLKEYSDLSGDTATNDFTDNAEDLIMLHTLKNLFAEDKQDPTYATMYAELEEIEDEALDNRSDAIIGTGRIKTNPIL